MYAASQRLWEFWCMSPGPCFLLPCNLTRCAALACPGGLRGECQTPCHDSKTLMSQSFAFPLKSTFCILARILWPSRVCRNPGHTQPPLDGMLGPRVSVSRPLHSAHRKNIELQPCVPRTMVMANYLLRYPGSITYHGPSMDHH